MNAPHGMFPVRHWFDDNEDLSQQESFSDAVTDADNAPVTQSQNTTNRRDAQSSPVTRSVYTDSGREDEIQQPPPGADGTTGIEIRRPPTRSASRGGRTRSSVDTMASGVIDSRDNDSGIEDGLSPINVASAAALSNGDSPPISLSLFHGPERRGAGVSPAETGRFRRHNVNQTPNPNPNELFSPGVVLLPHHQQGQILDQPEESRGRRSLSDFVREIEEMVRAQRAENIRATTVPRTTSFKNPSNVDYGQGMGRAYPFAPLVSEHGNGGGEAGYFPMYERRRSRLHYFLSGGPQVQHQQFVRRGQGHQLAVRPGRSSGEGWENNSGRGGSRAYRRGLGYSRSRAGGGGAVSSSVGTIQREGVMGHLVDHDEFQQQQQQQQIEQMQRRYMGNPPRGDSSPPPRAITAEGRPGNEASRTSRGDAQQQEEEMQSVETSSSSSGSVGSPRGNMDGSGETQLSRPRFPWQTNRSESLSSGGTLTLPEPSPRGFHCKIPGRVDPDEDAIEVEKALFSSLTSLGVRRLLVRRDKGLIANSSAPHTSTYHSPEWLNKWLEDGGRLMNNSGCSASSGDDLKCPHFGDLWELLELVIFWWSDRVCAVAAGISISREGGREERMGHAFGDPVSAARAVEAVQDLRELTKSFVPLARVRYFISTPGGPTPREAVILKIILVIHEGIAWAIDRPRRRYYREEVIPTALEFYANLPQGILEGVDIEVGHKLPEAMFRIAGIARPSWQRYPRRFSNNDGYGSRGREITAEEEERGDDDNRSSGREEGRRSCSAGGLDGWVGFEPGPWIIFRLTQTEYMEFYRSQAVALEAIEGMGDMLC